MFALHKHRVSGAGTARRRRAVVRKGRVFGGLFVKGTRVSRGNFEKVPHTPQNFPSMGLNNPHQELLSQRFLFLRALSFRHASRATSLPREAHVVPRKSTTLYPNGFIRLLLQQAPTATIRATWRWGRQGAAPGTRCLCCTNTAPDHLAVGLKLAFSAVLTQRPMASCGYYSNIPSPSACG